jgi:uncharacterized protein with von Willebrand factor type A (vWA) domain
VDDFEVVETERRGSAAVALCVDLSWSMELRDYWGPMKQTALALSHLVATKYPQDALQIIGFGLNASPLSQTDLRRGTGPWTRAPTSSTHCAGRAPSA